MQVLDEESKAYFNFIKSLNSESTRNSYKFCLEKFLNHYEIDLASFLKSSQEEMSNLIIKYLVDEKISKGYLAIDPKYDKLLTSLRTAYANEFKSK
ncbi:MAG: hypothetical protein E6L03_02020 [Thaumarchaeota archaeon]|nr:MAG: hypothetical protein E6L03_02020 [Nitrososphaerota archaeon]